MENQATRAYDPSLPLRSSFTRKGRGFFWASFFRRAGLAGLPGLRIGRCGAIRAPWGIFRHDAGVRRKYHSLSKFARDKVAIISVPGVIMGRGWFIKHQIERVATGPARSRRSCCGSTRPEAP